MGNPYFVAGSGDNLYENTRRIPGRCRSTNDVAMESEMSSPVNNPSITVLTRKSVICGVEPARDLINEHFAA